MSAGGTNPAAPVTDGSEAVRTSVWRVADFRRLWIGESLSVAGQNLGTLAIPVIAVVLLHASAQQVGLLTAAQLLAFLVIGLPVGVWVDRLRKRHVMMAADAVRAAALLTIPLAWTVGALHIWQLYVVALVVGCGSVFFDVSYQSIVPELVEPQHVAPANGHLQASAQVARVGGPALSGLLLTVVRAPFLLVATALGYLASLIAVATIRGERPPVVRAERRSLIAEVGEGLRFVFGDDLLRRITINSGVVNLGLGTVTTLVSLFILRHLGFSPAVYGLVQGIGAGGGILGALAAPWLTRWFGEGPIIVWGEVLVSCSAVIFLLAAAIPKLAVPLLVVGYFGWSFGAVNYNIAQLSFRQRLCPPELLGRMNASIRFVIYGVSPIASTIAGLLGGSIGLLPTMWGGLVVAAVGTFAVLFFSPIRTMRNLPRE
ncbi:MFS transporter [Curtobacterium ammoniigenes]|uniref:MFS transporter n=1 Tax=Curtobacterium ammoniigenes TaxID=395387 RepID=UPI00082E8799|nr:MFS transporter [Curtobacterium ammoniigenes]